MTTFRETALGVWLVVTGATLTALVLVQGVLAQPPIALPVGLLAIGAGIATLDVPEPAATPDAVGPGGAGRRPA